MTPFILKFMLKGGVIVVTSTGIPLETCDFTLFYAGNVGQEGLSGGVGRRIYRKGVRSQPPNFGYFFSPTLSHFFWDNFVGQTVGQDCQEGSDFSELKWIYNFC